MITAIGAFMVLAPLLSVLLEAGVLGPLRSRGKRSEPARGEDPARVEQEIARRLYRQAGLDAGIRVRRRPEARRRLKIAMLAPPWIPVPPPGYGGIEAVVDLLCKALLRRGHEVVLFAAPGSRSDATLLTPLEEAVPDQIGKDVYAADHVARAFELIEAGAPDGRPFDVVHDHCGSTAVAMADRLAVPVVHTLHGPLDEADSGPFYARHGHKVLAVAISAAQAKRAPDSLRIAAVVPNPIDVAAWPFVTEKDDYLLWVGRMTPGKGPHRAIDVARRAGAPLVLAGPVQPGQEEYFREQVEPRLASVGIDYIGEVGGRRKADLFAHARALLMPIRWPEPFGMVMVEALATGTPVLAFPEGAAPEIVADGVTGFLAADEAEMATAVARHGEIDPRRCRDEVERRYHPARVAAAYERIYRRAAATPTRAARTRPGATRSTAARAAVERRPRAVAEEGGHAHR
ncbi:MAG TPA: glycosyltransferase family 4 protein [Solirubrobacterales bacterium]|nr:glycosyltransferase family 4 protein [Solirubrobacterales bacterium]